MSYHFRPGEPLAEGVRRVVREEIQQAIAEIDDEALDRHEAVHQVRKRCKKIRATLRLVRPNMKKAYRNENAFFRDAAKKLSALRDAQAQVETFDLLMGEDVGRAAQFAVIRNVLVAQRDALAKEQGVLEARLAEFRDDMCAALGRIAEWPVQGSGFAVIEAGLAKSYGRGRKALKNAYKERTATAFHEWRKRVKYHWYHVRLLEGAWPAVCNALRDELKQLSDYLGDDHDLAVLRGRVAEVPIDYGPTDTVEQFLELLDARRMQFEMAAQPLGWRVYAAKPKKMAAKWRVWWEAGVEEARRAAGGQVRAES